MTLKTIEWCAWHETNQTGSQSEFDENFGIQLPSPALVIFSNKCVALITGPLNMINPYELIFHLLN